MIAASLAPSFAYALALSADRSSVSMECLTVAARYATEHLQPRNLQDVNSESEINSSKYKEPWKLQELVQDLQASPEDRCLRQVLAQAVKDEKQYWEDFSERNSCSAPAHETPECDSYAFSKAQLQFIEVTYIDREEVNSSAPCVTPPNAGPFGISNDIWGVFSQTPAAPHPLSPQEQAMKDHCQMVSEIRLHPDELRDFSREGIIPKWTKDVALNPLLPLPLNDINCWRGLRDQLIDDLFGIKKLGMAIGNRVSSYWSNLALIAQDLEYFYDHWDTIITHLLGGVWNYMIEDQKGIQCFSDKVQTEKICRFAEKVLVAAALWEAGGPTIDAGINAGVTGVKSLMVATKSGVVASTRMVADLVKTTVRGGGEASASMSRAIAETAPADANAAVAAATATATRSGVLQTIGRAARTTRGFTGRATRAGVKATVISTPGYVVGSPSDDARDATPLSQDDTDFRAQQIPVHPRRRPAAPASASPNSQ